MHAVEVQRETPMLVDPCVPMTVVNADPDAFSLTSGGSVTLRGIGGGRSRAGRHCRGPGEVAAGASSQGEDCGG